MERMHQGLVTDPFLILVNNQYMQDTVLKIRYFESDQ